MNSKFIKLVSAAALTATVASAPVFTVLAEENQGGAALVTNTNTVNSGVSYGYVIDVFRLDTLPNLEKHTTVRLSGTSEISEKDIEQAVLAKIPDGYEIVKNVALEDNLPVGTSEVIAMLSDGTTNYTSADGTKWVGTTYSWFIKPKTAVETPKEEKPVDTTKPVETKEKTVKYISDETLDKGVKVLSSETESTIVYKVGTKPVSKDESTENWAITAHYTYEVNENTGEVTEKVTYARERKVTINPFKEDKPTDTKSPVTSSTTPSTTPKKEETKTSTSTNTTTTSTTTATKPATSTTPTKTLPKTGEASSIFAVISGLVMSVGATVGILKRKNK